jgi:hypothetical protein
MTLSLNVAAHTHLRRIVLHWLLKQVQRCQTQSGSCISPAADHLLSPKHRLYRAAVVSSQQQNFLNASVTQARASRLRALTLAVTLGVSFCFTNGAALANGCSGNQVISTPVTQTQEIPSILIPSPLCSFTVNSGASIVTTTGIGIDNSGTITALTNSGTISGNSSGIDNSGTITTLTNSGTILGVTVNGIFNDHGTITTLTNSSTITGGETGIFNDHGTITTLTNSSRISGGFEGIFNGGGTITTLTNSLTISGDYVGIQNSAGGTIGELTNSGTGTIRGGAMALLTKAQQSSPR